MVCCLLALAVLGPFGIGVLRDSGDEGGCCASKRRPLTIAAVVLSIALLGVGVFLMLQPAPFHHICRFIVSRS